MIHRALLGSLERFIGIYSSISRGDFPPWLAPEQVRVLPVADTHRADAESLADDLRVHGFRAWVDERDETLGRRIRDAELSRSPTSSSGASGSRSSRSRCGGAAANRSR